MRPSRNALSLLALVGLLAGCIGPVAFSGFDAKELEALAKIKDSTTTCITGANPMYGKVTIVFASVDKGIAGTLTVAEDCKVTIVTEPKALPPKP